MGLFSKKKELPTLDYSGVKKILEGLDPTIQPSYNIAGEIGQQYAPLALGARESALSDIATPEAATSYFSGFQPTSFEQGITGTFFEDALNKARRTAAHRASLSGIESAFPDLFSQAISPTVYNIGTYLSDLANQRATSSLNARLGIDPFSQILNPLAGANLEQSNYRTSALADVERAQAEQNFLRAMAEYGQPASGLGRTIGGLAGGIGGLFLGGPAGALTGYQLGSGLGGVGEGLFGEGEIGLSDLASLFGGVSDIGNLNLGKFFGKGGSQAGIGGIGGVASGKAERVYDFPSSGFEDPAVYNPSIVKERMRNPFGLKDIFNSGFKY